LILERIRRWAAIDFLQKWGKGEEVKDGISL
jgi:hypothetical protein